MLDFLPPCNIKLVTRTEDPFASRKRKTEHKPKKPSDSPSVIRRNERERNRIRVINRTFKALHQALPCEGRKRRRMSKVDILKNASNYIMQLQNMLYEYNRNLQSFCEAPSRYPTISRHNTGQFTQPQSSKSYCPSLPMYIPVGPLPTSSDSLLMTVQPLPPSPSSCVYSDTLSPCSYGLSNCSNSPKSSYSISDDYNSRVLIANLSQEDFDDFEVWGGELK